MEDLLDLLAAHDLGLLITVDEVSPQVDEMVTLAATYQHFVIERRRGYVGFDLPLFGEFLAQKDADGGLT